MLIVAVERRLRAAVDGEAIPELDVLKVPAEVVVASVKNEETAGSEGGLADVEAIGSGNEDASMSECPYTELSGTAVVADGRGAKGAVP